MSTDLIGSGEAYTTPALWWADIPATLLEAEIGRGTNTAEIVTSAATDFSGKTVGAFSIVLETETGDSFRDHANKLTNALRYNEANGTAWSNSGNVDMITVGSNPMTFRHWQFEMAAGYGYMVNRTDAAPVVFDSCIFDGHTLTGTQQLLKLRGTTLQNSLIIDRSTDGAGDAVFFDGDGSIVSCSIVRIAAATARRGIEQYVGTVNVLNTAVFGFFDSDFGTFTGSNNASDLTLGFGSANQNALSYAAQFENISGGTEDFRAKAAGGLLANGTSSGTPTTDILGQTRDTSRDIGAHEQIAGGGGTDVGAKINAGLIGAGKLRGLAA
jgi:hypothetical protein